MWKYGICPDPYFPVFGLNTKKYGPEKTPYFDIFHAVTVSVTRRRHNVLLNVTILKDRTIPIIKKNEKEVTSK